VIDKPTPLLEENYERFWPEERWDQRLRKLKGFCSDFILATRGIGTPTVFSLWTSLFCVSSVLKRHAWLQWHPGNLFGNLWVFLVAPPKICHKSTAAEMYGEEILRSYHKYIDDPREAFLKSVNVRVGSISPEGIAQAAKQRETDEQILAGGNLDISPTSVKTDSEIAFIISELKVMFSNQKYVEGLIPKLMNLYGCKRFDDHETISHGHQVIENVFVTLLGAVTPEVLSQNLPTEVYGDGFLSRINVIYQDQPTRRYAHPRAVIAETYPADCRILERRLAWIAHTCKGGYTLNKYANEAYELYYHTHMDKLEVDIADGKRKLDFRFDNHLLKIAFLLRCQRYQEGNEIDVEDMALAKLILDCTFAQTRQIFGNVGAGDFEKKYSAIARTLKNHKTLARNDLLRRVGYKAKASDTTQVLNLLSDEGHVRINLQDGSRQAHASSTGSETYTWLDGEDD